MSHRSLLSAILAQAASEYVSATEVAQGMRGVFLDLRRTIAHNPVETAVVVGLMLLLAWGVSRMG